MASEFRILWVLPGYANFASIFHHIHAWFNRLHAWVTNYSIKIFGFGGTDNDSLILEPVIKDPDAIGLPLNGICRLFKRTNV